MASWTEPAVILDGWLGPDKPTDAALVQIWIDRAERLLRSVVPDLQARISAGLEPELLATVQDVVAGMVTRVFRNPEGVRQAQNTEGPFSTSVTFGGNVPGELHTTARDLARLQASSGQVAFSVDMIPRASPYHPANASSSGLPPGWPFSGPVTLNPAVVDEGDGTATVTGYDHGDGTLTIGT